MPRSFSTTVPKILMHNGNDFGGGNYRILQPASLLRSQGWACVQAHPYLLDSHVLEILAPDVIVLQFQQTDAQIEAMKRYRKVLPNTQFVYEIDDIFWQVPQGSIHKAAISPDVKQRINKAARICDTINVTSRRLAAEMKRLTSNTDIRIVPNDVPQHFINSALAGRRKTTPTTTKPRVGWAGGIGHTPDLEILNEVMPLLGNEVHWVFMGMVPSCVDDALRASLNMSDQDFNGLKHSKNYHAALQSFLHLPDEGIAPGLPTSVEFRGGVTFQEYPEALGSLCLDIALAPLVDCVFNRCKSDLRLIEYGACGFATIASKIETYNDCEHVVHVDIEPQAWADAIRDLIARPQKRRRLADSLHDWTTSTRCMDKNLEMRMRAYLPRNTEIFNPFSGTLSPEDFVLVGQAEVEGLRTFKTFEEAWAAAPGANVFYLRPDAGINGHQVARIAAALQPGRSAVCTLSNDGIYPGVATFAPIDSITGIKLDMTAMELATVAPVTVPFPMGPCILFSGAALRRFGLPSGYNAADPELGFPEWGARAAEAGMVNVMTVDTFTHAGSRVERPKEVIDAAMRHAVGWMPGANQMLTNFVQNDPLGPVREALDLFYHRDNYRTPRDAGGNTYDGWSKINDAVSPVDASAMREISDKWENAPHINIVMPVYNTPRDWLKEAVASVVNQVYPNWSLLIANDGSTEPYILDDLEDFASADDRIRVVHRGENGHICVASNDALEMAEPGWVIFLDHDDTLAPHALWMIAHEIVEHPDVEFIYSDADRITEEGKLDQPYFAPDFNYTMLLGSNYVTHIAAYKLEGIQQVGGLRVGYEGSQDWDLVLRYLAARCGTPPNRDLVRHIPAALYHWRNSPNSTSNNMNAKPYAIPAGRKAVTDHLRETGQLAMVGENPYMTATTMVRFLVPDPAPKVSIIIPTRDNGQVLARCVGSLLARTPYPNLEILIVDNGSKDQQTLNLLTQIAKDERVRLIRRPGPFNYAKMNNDAVEMATGEFICLLNDDTEIVEAAWLHDMVGHALRKGVGAVGAKLLYPNQTVQQNGIFIDWDAKPGMRALHAWQQLPGGHPGQAGRNVLSSEYVALTGACLLMRRSLYQEVGGLDLAFPVDYNDVDLCLRLHKLGYRNVAVAQAIVLHHEGVTKKKNAKEHSAARIRADEERLRARHGDVQDGMWNRNLTFHPHLAAASISPLVKPWSAPRERVLLVNGTTDDAMRAWQEGFLPFCATLDGHLLHITYPIMKNVKPVDMRGDVTPFLRILGMLGVSNVHFCGVGNGTVGAVGFMTEIVKLGWPVEYTPTETADFRDPHIDEDVWGVAFDRLRSAQQAVLSDMAAD